jgi:hypothetical protein
VQFGNPIVAGEDLIRTAIRSPDFSTDEEGGNVTGWRIAQDGTATFYNLVIGNANYNIDENGNAVFQSVSATDIILDGTDLATLLNQAPRGVIAAVALINPPSPSTTGTGTANGALFCRIVIPNFDPARAYRINYEYRPSGGTVTNYGIACFSKWDAPATQADNFVFREQMGNLVSSAALSYCVGASVIRPVPLTGTDLHLAFWVYASAAGVSIATSSNNYITIEDIGPAIAYGSYDMSGGGSPIQQYVKTYACTGSDSYQENGTNRGIDELYQGRYSTTNGNQFSMMAFPFSTIQSDLAGSTINKVELFLTNKHFYSNSGGEAIIGTHNQSPISGNHPSSQINDNLSSPSFALGQAKWVTLPNSIGNALRDNTAKGIALGPGPSTNIVYYGYFAGNGQSGEPQLRITYTK